MIFHPSKPYLTHSCKWVQEGIIHLQQVGECQYWDHQSVMKVHGFFKNSYNMYISWNCHKLPVDARNLCSTFRDIQDKHHLSGMFTNQPKTKKLIGTAGWIFVPHWKRDAISSNPRCKHHPLEGAGYPPWNDHISLPKTLLSRWVSFSKGGIWIRSLEGIYT